MNGLSRIAAFCALAALWISGDASAASVRAWLDRSSMQLGETVTLNVEVSGDTGAAQPDLSALAQDFDLLGTQSSTSVNIVNGQTSSKLLWAVGLSPKHEGTLAIPALSVAGQQTPPLTLSVQPATAGGSGGGDVYVETTVEPRAPYVQQQIRLSVKLFYAVNLLDGNLADPQGDGLIVRKLGQDSNYNANVGGRNFHVVERRYALFPEKSGSLTLPAITFRGHAVDGNSLDLFFNRGREISARSQPVVFDVRPRPAASGTDAWLPARSLTFSASGIDASSSLRAGEPLTLTLRVQAQGLGFEQLPELKLPAIDGVDIYPDKSSTQNRDDGEWLYGERERKFAIVPNRAGPLTLPAISISWWDTAHDRAETATAPQLTLSVEPGTATSQPLTAANPAKLTQPVTPGVTAAVSGAQAPGGATVRLWQGIAVAALALWLLTVAGFGWAMWRRRTRPVPTETSAPEKGTTGRRAFEAACDRGDLAQVGRILLERGRQVQPEVRNLGDLAWRLQDAEQREAIAQLERERFGSGSNGKLGGMLTTAFAKPLDFAPSSTPERANVLPDLYPRRA
jgi:hypothetical protein